MTNQTWEFGFEDFMERGPVGLDGWPGPPGIRDRFRFRFWRSLPEVAFVRMRRHGSLLPKKITD